MNFVESSYILLVSSIEKTDHTMKGWSSNILRHYYFPMLWNVLKIQCYHNDELIWICVNKKNTWFSQSKFKYLGKQQYYFIPVFLTILKDEFEI